MSRIIKYIKHPNKIVTLFNVHGFHWLFSDKFLLKQLYKNEIGRKLNLKNPQTFNEKLQWLKLNDRKSEYTDMVDKYSVKQIVAEKIGEQYVIPTLGIWDKFEDIEFNRLPDKFVLKCTHDSGGLVICKDKSKLDVEKARRKIKKSLKRNYFWMGREWPYKNVKPRIIAEELIENSKAQGEGKDSLIVYKIMTFNGEPKIIQVIQGDKTQEETIDYFDTSWNLLDIKQNFPNSQKHLSKPENLSDMIEFARKLSKGHKFLRVDFYDTGDKVYFSEFTFYSDCGTARFHPESWDYELGKWIDLGNK